MAENAKGLLDGLLGENEAFVLFLILILLVLGFGWF